MIISFPQDPTARAAFLMVGVAVVLFAVYRCLKDGVVISRGWKVERATRPLLYWLLITMFALLSGVLVWAAAVSLAMTG